jgi:hypothetical protein
MARPPAVETVPDLRHGLTRVGRWPAAGAAQRARSCEAPAEIAAVGADAVERELVVDDLGEGPGVEGEPDVIFAEPAAALVEVVSSWQARSQRLGWSRLRRRHSSLEWEGQVIATI